MVNLCYTYHHRNFVPTQSIQAELPASRSEQIKERALELGFHHVGIVRAESLSPERARLKEWLRQGFHGEMSYMARDPEQRTDPRKLFPQARSVVVMALNYYTPHQHQDPRKQEPGGGGQETGAINPGKISRYAWGDDYHEILGEKLRGLLQWIKERWPDAEGKVCVDIQPTMDKAWAARAGLGWIGKHTNLITLDYGSWVFIGELLLSLELEYDREVVEDHCGTCTLCLEACPTGAIVEPYVLDSNLCISHATIESRAARMRPDVASKLEGWLFGCDICQDVCPWNRLAQTTGEARFEPREGNTNAKPSEILELTPETYAARFRHSAMKRAKLAGLRRNALALQSREALAGLGVEVTDPCDPAFAHDTIVPK